MARSGIAFEPLSHLSYLLVVAWKALSTGMLVLAAILVATMRHRRGLAAALAIILVADLFLASGKIAVAASLFIAAHLAAALAYWSVRQHTPIRTLAACCIPVLALAATWLLTRGTEVSPAMLAFPLFSSLSAAMAIRSRLPLWGNALGSTAFVLSDVIFVVAAAGIGAGPVGWLVWLTYFSGLALITQGLMADCRASDTAAPRSPSAPG